jgi:6-phosphogluconolactonase
VNWQARVSEDPEELSRAAAKELAGIAQAALESRGRFDLALAGGHTPKRLYEILAAEYRERIDWKRTHLFWGDERYVGADDPLSNYRMARESLIEPLALPTENVHPMPTSFAEPDDAARAYEKLLHEHFGSEDPRFDLVLLGIGSEGHTASLFPGAPALNEKQRWVLAVRVAAKPPLRLTLTLPAINAARQVFFLVSGADKKAIVAKLLSLGADGSAEYPASLVHAQEKVTLFLDRAAQPRVLFVCAGNTCRSPMAEAIAAKLLGGAAQVESAGTLERARDGDGPAAHAVRAMRERGLDISGHHSRFLDAVNPQDFDLVVALEPKIDQEIRRRAPRFASRLAAPLHVTDPIGGGPDDYRKAAEDIEKGIRSLFNLPAQQGKRNP